MNAATLLCTMAELRLDQGRWDRAIVHLEKALPLVEASGATVRMVEVHTILATAYRGAGRWEDAHFHLKSAETLSRNTQLLRFMPQLFLERACLHAAQSEFTLAETDIRSAEALAHSERSDVFDGLVHRCYGYLHIHQGDWPQAVKRLELSLEFLESTHLRTEVAKTHLSLGSAYARRGEHKDKERALKHLLAAQSFFQQIEAPGRLAQVQMQKDAIDHFSDGSTKFPGREK